VITPRQSDESRVAGGGSGAAAAPRGDRRPPERLPIGRTSREQRDCCREAVVGGGSKVWGDRGPGPVRGFGREIAELNRKSHFAMATGDKYLFQYLDEGGARRRIGSDNINAYLREASGEAFTSKHFRTCRQPQAGTRPQAPGPGLDEVETTVRGVAGGRLNATDGRVQRRGPSSTRPGCTLTVLPRSGSEATFADVLQDRRRRDVATPQACLA
jgi:hypothetical protein